MWNNRHIVKAQKEISKISKTAMNNLITTIIFKFQFLDFKYYFQFIKLN